MDHVNVTVGVTWDERGWHYTLRATEGRTLLAALVGDFVEGATLDQVEAFCGWAVRAVLRPRLGEDAYNPPAATGAQPAHA